MQQFYSDEPRSKVERLAYILICSIAAFYALICTPVYILASTNILLKNSIFPTIWDVVQTFIHFAFYWCFFAFLIFCGSVKHSKISIHRLAILYALCAFGRYFISLLIAYFMTAGTTGWDSFWLDFPQMLLEVLGDWVIGGLAVLWYKLWLAGKSCSLPEDSLFDIRNPVLKCIACSAAVPSFFSVISRIIYDVFFGAPQNKTDLIVMIVYYATDVISALAGYLIVFLLLTKISKVNASDEY